MPHALSLIRDRVVCVARLKDVDGHIVPVSDLLPANEEIGWSKVLAQRPPALLAVTLSPSARPEGSYPLDVAVGDSFDRLLARRLVVRSATNAFQNEVRPTAKPMNPGTGAAARSQAMRPASLEPRPRMMQPTLARPPRCAAVTTAAQSSRWSSPSIFHTSGSTPAFCNSLIAAIISDGRRSWS